MKLLKEYKALAKKNNETLAAFMKSEDYSNEYKEKAKVAAKGQMAQYKEQYEKLLNGILDNAITSVNNKISERSLDKDYQLALSNAFRMLELAGGNMDEREIKALTKPFANDEMANKAFRGIMSKNFPDEANNYKYIELFGDGNDTKTIKTLEKIKNNISKALDPEGPKDPFGSEDTYSAREMILGDVEDYISNKTDDDFRSVEK